MNLATTLQAPLAARPATRARRSRCRAGVQSAPCQLVSTSPVYCTSQSSVGSEQPALQSQRLGRRALLGASLLVPLVAGAESAQAFQRPPAGYKYWVDELDGYSFLYPANWLPVKSAGADVFFRSPTKVDVNLFVDASSPSSTKFASIDEFGSLDEAGKKLVAQYLIEFASTRIGVKREAKVIRAEYRTGADGNKYLDAEVNIKSFAALQQYGISAADRGDQVMEWDRRLVTTLGVAGGRLYSLRLQASEADIDAQRAGYRTIQDSFRCFAVTGQKGTAEQAEEDVAETLL